MKIALEFLIVTNLALFIINCMYAGMLFAQGFTGPTAFFAFAALAHALTSNYFKRVKEKRFPSET